MNNVIAMVPGRLLEESFGNKKSRKNTKAGAINKNANPNSHARKTERLTNIQPRKSHKAIAKRFAIRRMAMVVLVWDIGIGWSMAILDELRIYK